MCDFQKSALNQFYTLAVETLKKDPNGSAIQLPDNLAELMYTHLCEKSSENVPLVSVRDILCSEIQLPFMPNLIDYKIGKGCCGEIMKHDGLFTPCSAHCVGPTCAKHLKTPTGCGTYAERFAAWDKKEQYCVVIDEKEIKEKSYGAYLHGKTLDSMMVKEELQKWGINIKMDAALFRPPAKPPKKSRGRKPALKVAAADGSDSDAGDSVEDIIAEPAHDVNVPEPEQESETEASAEATAAAEEPNEAPAEAVVEASPEVQAEEPKETKKKSKKKKEVVVGTPLDGTELIKEEMEEKKEKKKKEKKPKEEKAPKEKKPKKKKEEPEEELEEPEE
jgi:hypothetical protein